MSEILLAIDPGNEKSGWCLIDVETLRPYRHGKDKNEDLKEMFSQFPVKRAVVERVASYGMAVGKDVFETCEWTGRFIEALERMGVETNFIYRKEEKLNLCGDLRAKDANIRRALIDRFAMHDKKTGKGTKKNPDWFYGFAADEWTAYAIGITFLDKMVKERMN